MTTAAPHHDGSALHVPEQAPALGDSVPVRLRVPDAFGAVESVTVRSSADSEPHWLPAVALGSADGWTWWEAPLAVENPTVGYRFLVVLADGTPRWVNATGVHGVDPVDAEDFRITAHEPPPGWGRSMVMYQVFPDRFARSAAADSRALPEWAEPAGWNDPVAPDGPSAPVQFYGGDLDGVIEHLDHLERLGVNLVYLTPFFPARSNHRYNADSFDVVDPLLGGDEALVRLVEAAHGRGMKVLGDLTTNHSGDGHEWFRSAHRNPSAPEADFYYWLDAEHEDYVSWLGFRSLPKFDWNSRELRRRFIEGDDSVVARWLKPPFSLDGWRIDVANMTGRYAADDLNTEVRRIIRRTMTEVNPDTLLLAEVTGDAAPDFPGDAWHGAMTYANFTKPVWGWLADPRAEVPSFFGVPVKKVPPVAGAELVQAHLRFAAGFPWRVRLHNMNALDTHDTARFASVAREGAAEVAFGLAVTMPGIPVVWQGDEFGLTAENGEHSRTPLPWDRIAEFEPTVRRHAELIRLRRSHPVLHDGGIRWLAATDDAIAFVREGADECVLVLATRAAAALDLAPDAVLGEPVPLYGDGSAERSAQGLRVTASGLGFAAWSLPGLVVPGE